MEPNDYAEEDRLLEERLIRQLREEGLLQRRAPVKWMFYAAAALAIFLLGVAVGARFGVRDSQLSDLATHSVQPTPESPARIQGVLWF